MQVTVKKASHPLYSTQWMVFEGQVRLGISGRDKITPIFELQDEGEAPIIFWWETPGVKDQREGKELQP